MSARSTKRSARRNVAVDASDGARAGVAAGTQPTKPRVRMTGQERREQLLDVGRALFAERGYEATSIEEIAERAKISKPIVYEHFGGKQGLYAGGAKKPPGSEGIAGPARSPRRIVYEPLGGRQGW